MIGVMLPKPKRAHNIIEVDININKSKVGTKNHDG
jgi:hypothetical protein